MESDALCVVNQIASGKPSEADVGLGVSDILARLQTSLVSSITYACRQTNGIAHSLAKMALTIEVDCFWRESAPICVEQMVLGDLPV
ncbi:hypothetical protein Q3G72_000552 [Acer saccharum]|nr:hypothetical protein Q3G72_000552 [Acer saccharum]